MSSREAAPIFIVFDFTQLKMEPDSAVLVADSLSTRPLIIGTLVFTTGCLTYSRVDCGV